MCSCSHAISAKEKSSTGTQQMARSRKCSLVIPKTQYSNSAFSDCCVSWIWSWAFRPFLQVAVWHAPFGACSGIFRHKLFTKSRFCCIVYKLPSTFLVLWHTKLQLFLQWLPLRHLTLCGTFVAWLVHSPMPKLNCSWRFLEHFWIFAKSEGEIKSMTHYSRRAT